MGRDYSDLMDANFILEQSTLADSMGIPLQNRFMCILHPAGVISDGSNPNSLINKLRFQVIAANVPNFQLDSGCQELNGVNRHYLKGRTDSDLSITFLENSKLSLRNLFYDWMKYAVSVGVNGVKRHYLNEYTAQDIIIAPLDVYGIARKGDRFIKPFPFAINNIDYDKTNSNEIIKTTVTFKYLIHDLVDIGDN